MPKFDVFGNDIQYIKVELGQGESVYADAGHILSKSDTVSLQTVMLGGFLTGLRREVTGGSFFVTKLTGPGQVAFAGIFPGKIVEVDLQGSSMLAQAHSFLVAEESVQYSSQMAKLAAGLLGGEGLFMAKFTGSGRLFIHSYGALQQFALGPGERIQVEAAHLLAFDGGMNYSVSTVGGIKTMLFAHEGLFFVNIEGPGNVMVHSLTAQQLAQAILPYIPRGQQGSGLGIRIG
ncbi:MAG: TIGR00266 family protein [Thermoprotei archaeon]|nr:TIGR00266 family protein [TACK group archaeon]